MSFPEIAWRIKQAMQMQMEKLGFGLAKYKSPNERGYGKIWLEALPVEFDIAAYKHAADKVLSGRFDILGISNADVSIPPNWNKDPKTGKVAPTTHGMTINFHDIEAVGDIKYIWELNRHMELVLLAQTYYLTNKKEYGEAIQILLNSWFDQCPYMMGPNWASSLELAIRLANWAFIWHFIGGDNSPLFSEKSGLEFKERWISSIYRHCHFIHKHFSLYSSANNHFFGENMGLFIAAITWPLWKESSCWAMSAKQILEEEAEKQFSSDGVNKEQAFWYQHEVVDMMLICAIFGKYNSIDFCPDYWKRLETALEFFSCVMDVGGNVPMIGDSDDGVMVRLCPSIKNFNVYRSLLASGAVLFNRADFKAKAGNFDDKSRWLLGDAAEKFFINIHESKALLPSKRAFPKGGYYLLGDAFESPDEIKLIVDAGPIGYLSIAAHGHADALSFCLSIGGREFIIDPGTYVYGYSQSWRNYFRGTSSHNTVRIDGLDQSQSGGNFMWLQKASCKCENFYSKPEDDFISAYHDGYCRLSDPVVHHRSIRFIKDQYSIEVLDRLECRSYHTIERFWHFSENCGVIDRSGVIFVSNDEYELQIRVLDGGSANVIHADNNVPLGWVSRHFDIKRPSTTAVFNNKIKGKIILKTLMSIKKMKADSINA